MNKPKVIVVGVGGHAKIVVDILEDMDSFEIIGVTAIDEKGGQFQGYPIIGDDSVLQQHFDQGVTNVAIGIGGFTNNKLREQVYKFVKSIGFQVVSAIHPSAVISKSVKLGEGVTIFPGVVITTEAVIGNNCIIATSATIDHETIIGDHVLISAGVTIGANTIIKEGVLCALGAKVVSAVTLGKEVLVAAGAVVVNDVEDHARVFGVPAKMR
jgi:sugar O-acyltransferase (sialic acid O-acetyltransferase NeuD family)